jgi:hypothetical protein
MFGAYIVVIGALPAKIIYDESATTLVTLRGTKIRHHDCPILSMQKTLSLRCAPPNTTSPWAVRASADGWR